MTSDATQSPGWRQGRAASALLTFAIDGETPILSVGRRYAEHAMTMTHQRFEPQVAVPRLLRLLADYDIQATFFVPGLVAERWPEMVTSVAEAGHEVGHHSYSHRPSTGLTASEERQEFERGLKSLAALGITPKGYRAPMWAATWRTAQLVAEFDMKYDSSLMDDDAPYRMSTAAGEVVEIPPHWSLDDWEQYAYLADPQIGTNIESPEKSLGMWTLELDAMRRYNGLFVLTQHAFLTGRAGRAEALRSLIETALSRGDVIFETAGDVAARVLSDPESPVRVHERYEPDPDIYRTW